MRITRSLLLTALFAITFSSVALANGNPNKKSSRVEIKNLIQKSDLFSDIREETTVHVNFMVNAKNEIIILSTDKKNLDTRIKAALNYKKLKSVDMSINKTYTLPIVLKK